MDKNKTLVNENQPKITNLEDLYTAVINNSELMEDFRNVQLEINQDGSVIMDGFEVGTLGKIKSILTSQKYFGYADGNDLILALFCETLYISC